MDMNGPYVNDLELGVNIVPTLQYGYSGFLTLQQVLDSFIIFAAQQRGINFSNGRSKFPRSQETLPFSMTWPQFSPANVSFRISLPDFSSDQLLGL